MSADVEIAEVAAAAWADVLGCDLPAQDANFFRLGGDSLAAMRMAAQLGERLGTEIAVQYVWDFPEFEQFVQQLRLPDPVTPQRAVAPISQVREPQVMALSYSQEGLLFLERAEMAKAAYNIPVVLRFCGALEPAALRDAFAEVVRRHEAFRTTFELTDSAPVQHVSAEGLIRFDVRKIGKCEADCLAATRELIRAHALESFDLQSGPMIRALLLELSTQEHWLLITTHHIVADGWSLHHVLIPELCALYVRNVGRAAVIGPAPREGHTAHARRQREKLHGDRLEELSRYWLNQLRGAPPLLALPIDRPRRVGRSAKADSQSFTITPDVCTKLQHLASQERASLFMVMLAAFQTLLMRWSGQTDIVVSAPIAGRNGQEEERVVGYFANALALRADVSPHLQFRQLLRQVRDTCLAAYAHADMPLERLVALLQPHRDPTYHPLVQASISFQRFSRDVLSLPDLAVTWLDDEPISAKLDLSIHVHETPTGLRCLCEYAAELFEAATIRKFCVRLAGLLTAFAQDPDVALGAVPLAAEARNVLESELELRDSRGSAASLPCAHELFSHWAAVAPESVAIECGADSLTYRALNERSNRLALSLAACGVKPDTVVAVYLHRSIDAVTALMAVLKAGGAFLALEVALPAERVSHMMDEAAVALTISSHALAEQLPPRPGPLLYIDDLGVGPAIGERLPPAPHLTPGNLAYIIFTSGSTGIPKGVLLEHGALSNLVVTQARLFDLTPDDRVLQFANFSFDASIWEIVMALCNGATLCMPAGSERDRDVGLLSVVTGHRITIATLPPSVLAALGGAQCGTISRLIVAGEACPVPVASHWKADRRLFNAYGPTEATVCASVGEYFGGTSVPIGYAIANARLYVLDEGLTPVLQGIVGELYISGVCVGRGYCRRPGLTAERFIADPIAANGARMYRTGDRARFAADGAVEFVGRDDGQVKLRGYRIELGEIEETLLSHPEVTQAAVVPRKHNGLVTELVAHVVTSGTSVTPHALRHHLGRTLPGYMIPAALVCVPGLPLTENGKIDRRQLALESDAVGAVSVGRDLYDPPVTALERALAGAWEKVLRIERVGVTENFFDLGGDSILSLRLQTECQRLGIHFSLLQLLEQQTIRGLARVALRESGEGLASAAPFSLVSERDAERARAAHFVDAYPLSRLQMGMIFHSQWQQHSKVYHAVTSHRIGTSLKVAALDLVIGRLIARHEALRTTFHLSGYEEPLQCVQAEVTISVVHDDLSALDDTGRQLALDRFIELEQVRDFALGQDPPVRFFCHKLAEDCFQLTLSAHHAILDGWSDALLLSELYQDYLVIAIGGEPELRAALPIGYRDFIAAERRALADGSHKTYWAERVAARQSANHRFLIPTTDIDEAAECIREPLSEPLCEAVRELARRAAVPPKSVYFAAHLQTLRILTAQECVVSGLVVNARLERPHGEEVLGLFLNTVPIQLAGGEVSWLELTQRVFALEQEALEHREYPLVELLSGPGRQSAIEIMFDYVNPHVYDDRARGVRIEDVPTFARTNYALATCVVSNPFCGSREALISFRTDRLKREDARRIGRLYVNVLEEMVVRPRELGNTDSLLSRPDCAFLAQGRAAESRGVDAPLLPARLASVTVHSASRVALVADSVTLTYAELDVRARRIAKRLFSVGIGPDTIVGACFGDPVSMVVAFVAIMRAGGVFLPLDPGVPIQRLEQILDESRAAIVLVDPLGAEALPAFPGLILGVDEQSETTDDNAPQNIGHGLRPENLAYVVYTSGSTGRPKGTLVTHGGLANLLQGVEQTIGIEATDRVLQFAPWSFDAAIWEIATTLTAGATLCLPDRVRGTVVALGDAIHRYQASIVTLPPSALRSLGEEAFPHLRTVVVAGEACPVELAARWSSRCELINAYGPTETTICATQGRLSKGETQIHVGLPLPGITCHILTGNLVSVPVGMVGELWIGGRGVARGYLGRPGLTASRFIANPFLPGERLYRSGDLARLRPDGSIELLGRIDRQVKIRGNRVELGEVENALSACAGVGQAIVIVQHSAEGDPSLIAYVAGPSDGRVPDRQLLREELRTRLPDYMIPRYIVVLPSLPVTLTGKLDRAALPAPDGARPEIEPYVAPQNALQTVLAAGWAQILEIEKVGIHDNFFDLGGHSLVATRVVAWMRTELELDVPIKALFDCPTVASLSEHIENIRWLKAGNPIDPASVSKPLRLLAATDQQI